MLARLLQSMQLLEAIAVAYALPTELAHQCDTLELLPSRRRTVPTVGT
jgi:hypothetical protein